MRSAARRPTIYEALKAKLGREPTNAELKADVQRILREGTQEMAAKGKLRHQRRNPRRRVVHKNVPRRSRNPAARYFITATKKGTHYFYAGGARFTTHVRDAIRFPSVVHATKVKDEMLRDFPAQLLKGTLLGIRLET